MEEFDSVTFETPKDPVYVTDNRKKRKRNQGGSKEESGDVVVSTSRSPDMKEEDNDEEEIPPNINHKRKRTEEGYYYNSLYSTEEDIDMSAPHRISSNQGKVKDNDIGFTPTHTTTSSSPSPNTPTPPTTQAQNIVQLKFNSEWTGTSKNIEMYSVEMQARKNQLEIDIGIRTQ